MSAKFDLGIRAGHLLSMAGGRVEVEKDRFIGVRGGEIVKIASFTPALKRASKKFIDGQGQACLPGLVNGHTHLPMALFKGVAEDLTFHDWLFERILPLEAKLVSPAFVRDGLELAALECIRFGVTTVNEMYFFAGEEAKVLDKAGLRGIIAQCMASFPLPEDKVVGTDKFAVLEKLQARFQKHPRLIMGMGPHAPYSCDDALLTAVKNYAEKTGAPVHIHLSETSKEVAESQEKFGKSPVERVQGLGLLRKGTICAHCVHLSDSDRAVFQKSGASVVYNPDSNSKLGAGVAPVADYLARGIPVALGTDGSASNNDLSVFGAIDIGTKLQKLTTKEITAFGAHDALRLATWGGARALGLGDKVGSLEEGKRADLILIDLSFPHLQPIHNLASQLVFATQGCEVSTTICDGKVLYRDGKFTTLEPRKIYAKAESWRKKIAAVIRDRRSD